MPKRYGYYAAGLLLAMTAGAEEIGARLQDGTPLLLDPVSRSVQILKDGVAGRPLWDGVHRLDNGATLTISGGVLIHQTDPTQPGQANLAQAPSRCEVLVAQVCGTQDQCTTSSGCQAARQLLGMEQREHRPGDRPTMATATSNTCLEAARDRDYFVPCQQTNSDH